MSGAFLRRRDQTVRPLRVDHYSAAVNRRPTVSRPWPRSQHSPLKTGWASRAGKIMPNGTRPSPDAHHMHPPIAFFMHVHETEPVSTHQSNMVAASLLVGRSQR